jgi:hypothetical protein
MKKRKKSRNYHITGSVEVCHITRGKRKVCILNLNKEVDEEFVENSGSIVTKSPIYRRNATQISPQEEIFSSGSCT